MTTVFQRSIQSSIDTFTTNLAVVDAVVDEISSATNSKTFNTTALASIEGEAEDALEGENLDHLAKVAVDTSLDNTVHDTSVLGYILASSDVANFDRIKDSLEVIGNRIACLYKTAESVPILEPTTTNVTPIAVDPNSTAHQWGSWVKVIDGTVIDSASGTNFDVQEVELQTLTSGALYYFEFDYSTGGDGSNVCGRGYVKPTGVGQAIIRDANFKFSIQAKVTNNDLYMRTMCNEASKECDVLPIMWCSGTP